MSAGGMDDYTLAGNVQQQRTVKTQCQPQGVVTRSRNIKHPVQDGNVAVCTAPDAEFARQIIIIAFIPGLSFDKMEEFAFQMKKLGFTSVKFSEMSTDDPEDPNFIDLQKLLEPYCDDVHQNDTLQEGCYLEPKSLEKRFGIKTILNLTCNLKTPIKQSQFQLLNYEQMHFDSIYISPDGSIHKRIVASQDLANDRGAC